MIMMLLHPQASCGSQGGSTKCLVAIFELSEANNKMFVAKAGLMTEDTQTHSIKDHRFL
jgi:hypothetical protein